MLIVYDNFHVPGIFQDNEIKNIPLQLCRQIAYLFIKRISSSTTSFRLTARINAISVSYTHLRGEFQRESDTTLDKRRRETADAGQEEKRDSRRRRRDEDEHRWNKNDRV